MLLGKQSHFVKKKEWAALNKFLKRIEHAACPYKETTHFKTFHSLNLLVNCKLPIAVHLSWSI